MKLETKVERAITELNRSMKLSAEREEFEAAGDMQRIRNILNEPREKTFSYSELEQLQSKVYEIVGEGDIMMLFDSMLGVSAGNRA
jgi:hypothetical protein